jgi:hypothetical protein
MSAASKACQVGVTQFLREGRNFCVVGAYLSGIEALFKRYLIGAYLSGMSVPI